MESSDRNFTEPTAVEKVLANKLTDAIGTASKEIKAKKNPFKAKTKATMAEELRDSMKEFKRLQMVVPALQRRVDMLSTQIAKDLSLLEERKVQLWRFTNGIYLFLKDKCGMTDDQLDAYVEKHSKEVAEFQLQKKKEEAKPGHTVCTHCFYIAEREVAFKDGECIRCKSKELWDKPVEVKFEEAVVNSDTPPVVP